VKSVGQGDFAQRVDVEKRKNCMTKNQLISILWSVKKRSSNPQSKKRDNYKPKENQAFGTFPSKRHTHGKRDRLYVFCKAVRGERAGDETKKSGREKRI